MQFRTLARTTAAMIGLGASAVHAATFGAVIDGENYTIVEVDPYKAGDTPGNTLRAPGEGTGPWAISSGTATDGLWNERTYVAFDTGYISLPGATDRVFEVSGDDVDDAPALRTTVSGLAPELYEVFLV